MKEDTWAAGALYEPYVGRWSRLVASDFLGWVAAPPDLGFPYVRQVVRVQRRRIDKRTGEVLSDETAYAVTSLAPDQATPKQLLRLWRRHWWIEKS